MNPLFTTLFTLLTLLTLSTLLACFAPARFLLRLLRFFAAIPPLFPLRGSLRLLALLVAFAFATLTEARAQISYGVPQFLTGGTNFIAAVTTNTYRSTLKTAGIKLSLDAGLTVSFKGSGGGTTNVLTFVFQQSADGTTNTISTDNSSLLTWTITANGTNTVIATTNLSTPSFGYLHLISVANTNTPFYYTNVLAEASTKNRIRN